LWKRLWKISGSYASTDKQNRKQEKVTPGPVEADGTASAVFVKEACPHGKGENFFALSWCPSVQAYIEVVAVGNSMSSVAA
jgi:hypothetical protein